MSHRRGSKILSAIAYGIVLALLPSAASGQDTPPADKWTFRLAPYFWLPSVEGEAIFELPDDGGQGRFSISPELDFAFIGTVEARRGRWSILVDAIYLDVGSDEGHVTVPIVPGGPGVELDAHTGLQSFVGHLVVGRTLVPGPKATLDLFGGIRYLALQTEADLTLFVETLPTRHAEAEIDLVDGIVGVRGNIGLGEKWYAAYYLDLGAGGSEFSWQAVAGIGYRLKWGDLLLGYRHLDVDPDGEPIEGVQFNGIVFGVGFRL